MECSTVLLYPVRVSMSAAKTRPRVPLPAMQQRGDDALARICLDIFMSEINAINPKVIRNFADSVTQVATPGRGPIWDRASTDFIRWAEKWKLVPPRAVFVWALRTEAEWRRDPRMKGTLGGLTSWTLSDFNTAINSEHPNTQSLADRTPVEPLEAFPDLENRRAFLARAARHWEARLEALRRAGKVDLVGHAADRDVRWLAQIVVGKKTYSQISREPENKTKQETVKRGVRDAASIIGLDLPLPKPGRPRR